MKNPIIYINKKINNQTYLNYFPQILSITKKFTDAPVVYISDDEYNSTLISEKHKTSFTTAEIEKFRVNYEHMSSNSVLGELVCFERWFILREYMLNNNINQCIYLDSDVVLLNRDYDALFEENFDISASMGHALHCSFIKNIDFIVGFTDYILDFYVNKNQDFIECKKIYTNNYKNKNNGGIVDMYLFYMYSKTNKHKTIELSKIKIDSSSGFPYLYDHNMFHVDGFKTRNFNDLVVKDLLLNDNKIFTTNIKNEKIWMKSLHFQGASKNILCNKNYYSNILLN